MRVILFFIDGLGLGSNDTTENPLVKNMPFFNSLFGDDCFINNGKIKQGTHAVLKPIDAQLGVPGLPQSATGQTALFTGENAAQILGFHLTATPNTRLAELLKEKSILKQLKNAGFSVTGVNAYSQQYLEKADEGELPYSASSFAIMASGEPFRLMEDLRQNKAVFMDITNEHLLPFKYEGIKKITPRQAAKNLLAVSAENHFCLYEYFLTDYYGHGRGTIKDVIRILKHIDSFTRFTVKSLPPDSILIITSDHGNIEKLNHKPHTTHPVPFIVVSSQPDWRKYFIHRVHSIVDVTPAILEAFQKWGEQK